MWVFLQFFYPIIRSEKIDYSNITTELLFLMIGVFVMAWGLAIGAYITGRTDYVLLQPIIFTEDGIQGPLIDRNHKTAWYWQKPASQFFRWSDIHLISRFVWSEVAEENQEIQDKGGISLIAGLHKITIYEHIIDVTEVMSILNEKLPHLTLHWKKTKKGWIVVS